MTYIQYALNDITYISKQQQIRLELETLLTIQD